MYTLSGGALCAPTVRWALLGGAIRGALGAVLIPAISVLFLPATAGAQLALGERLGCASIRL